MNSKTTCRAALLVLAILLLSTGVATARDNSKRVRLLAEITRLGGKVEFDETRLDKPIVKVDLHGTQVTNDDLAVLKNSDQELKELRYLDLRLTKIGDEGVAKLANLKSLQTLNLFRTQLGDAGLARLKKLTNLETLLIGGTKVTDAGLTSLRPFKKLKKLSLFQTQVSDQGIAQLKLMTSLEVLLISGSRISPAGAEELQRAMPKVRFSEST